MNVGDLVTCVKPELATFLDEDIIYTISCTHGTRELIQLKECKNNWWYDSARFEVCCANG